MSSPQPPQPSPWDKVKRYAKYPSGTIEAPETGHWCLWHQVDTARAQVEAQHAEVVAELKRERDAAHQEIASYRLATLETAALLGEVQGELAEVRQR